MKKMIFLAISLLIILSGLANAQSVPPPPAPIAETDLRDNTTKMRLIELERIKREAKKMRPEEISKAREVKFEKTKENFENIQKLQDLIIQAYTTSKKVDYSKIDRSASAIRKNSLWLDKNLFGAKREKSSENRHPNTTGGKSVKDLIIELDTAIGTFVKSPIFQDARVVDSKISEAARLELNKIIKLSKILSLEAREMQ